MFGQLDLFYKKTDIGSIETNRTRTRKRKG